MKFTTWYEMSTRFVNPITYKYLLISTNIVQLFDFVDFALRVKKLRIILIIIFFFYFLWYFSVYFKFSREIWTKISSKFTKKMNFWTELNFFVQFIQYTDNFELLSSEFFNQRATFPKSNAIWKMNTHNFLRHVKTWNLQTLIGVFD